jgi:hypothetical protein
VADAKTEALDRWIDEQQRSRVFVGTPQVGRAGHIMLDRSAAPERPRSRTTSSRRR